MAFQWQQEITWGVCQKREDWEIDNLVKQEKQEIRDIYTNKGFKDELLEEIVKVITSRLSPSHQCRS